jgi:tetratricopeptide (TPR) repeat protein
VAAQPGDGQIAARLASIAAVRALWFDGGAEARARAEQAATRAERSGAATFALAARALLRLGAGDAAAATATLRPTVAQNLPEARFALGIAEEARGDLAAAEEQLGIAWSAAAHPGLAACELAAVQRRRGRFEEARATLEALRAASPQNLCARLEGVLLLRQSGAEGTRVERESLKEPSAPHAALRARQLHAEALVAAASGEHEQVRALLGEATTATPWVPEIAWALGRALLAPGGDARRAAAQLATSAAVAGVPEALLDLADAQLRMGRAADAVGTLEKAAAAALPDLHRGRHQALLVTARHDLLLPNAVHVYCAAVEQAARPDEEVLLACGLIAHEERAYTASRRLAGRITRVDMKPIARGLTMLAQGDPASAAEPLGRAVEGHVAPGLADLLLADALEAAGRDEQARAALAHGAIEDAQSVRTRVALARALAAAGQRAPATALIDAVLAEEPTAPRLRARIALVLAALGEHARASKALAASAVPESPYFHFVTAQLALAAHDDDLAQKELRAAAAADPSYAEPRFELARLAAAGGRVDEATAHYDAAMRPTPDDPYARLRLAVAQAEAGFGEEAERSLEVARKGLEPLGARGLIAEAYVALARAAAAGDAKRARRADRLFEQALALPQAPAFAFYRAAQHHEVRHNLKAALAEYRAAVERDPVHAEAHLRLGLLLASDAKTRDEAPAQLRAYLKLMPQGAEAARARAELERLGVQAP